MADEKSKSKEYVVYNEREFGRYATLAKAQERFEYLNYLRRNGAYYIKEVCDGKRQPCPCCGMVMQKDNI